MTLDLQNARHVLHVTDRHDLSHVIGAHVFSVVQPGDGGQRKSGGEARDLAPLVFPSDQFHVTDAGLGNGYSKTHHTETLSDTSAKFAGKTIK